MNVEEMTQTDELRRLLGERGVPYETRDGAAGKNTYWEADGRRWGYFEDVSKSGAASPTLFLVSGELTVTAEQAIEATLDGKVPGVA